MAWLYVPGLAALNSDCTSPAPTIELYVLSSGKPKLFCGLSASGRVWNRILTLSRPFVDDFRCHEYGPHRKFLRHFLSA